MGAQWKQKGREASANAKGRIFSKLAKEIIIAARDGADPNGNARLRMALEAARKQSMTKDTIERAIKKGAGLTDGTIQYDSVTYEGFTPHRVPVIVECLTDNKNRTSANIKGLFRKAQLGNSGAVSWDFSHIGSIDASPPEGKTVDPEEAAIEAGAQDLEAGEDGSTIFYTNATDVDSVAKALGELGWAVSSAKLIWKAKNPVTTLDDAQRTEVEAFLSSVDEDDDVQNIYVAL
ncbi:MAG: YebC/PmpR family DNA-binding transcriptional regulator [Sandaracinaceae bacterium]|nr:YebC/PmpR family DNA-binding transcriptional regulator [Sandaracinaceae bacterium]